MMPPWQRLSSRSQRKTFLISPTLPRGSPSLVVCGRTEDALAFINLRSGIDVYAHWKGKTLAEERAQITGHSVAHGHVGYLREAYDGEPYAIQVLCSRGSCGRGGNTGGAAARQIGRGP